MPQADPKVKRIVSTNFGADDNPLQSAKCAGQPCEPPFLVMAGGEVQKVTSEGFAGNWDLLILYDRPILGLGKFPTIPGPIEVLWLHHKVVALKQKEALEAYFDKGVVFEKIPFQHGPDGYARYLSKVAALWADGGTYGTKLAELDIALRTEKIESTIVDFLWLLSAITSGIGANEELTKIFREKLSEVRKWAATGQRCPDFKNLEDAMNKATVENRPVAYRNLKIALKNSLASHKAD